MINYLDVLAEHGLDPQETSGGRELAMPCPLCDDPKRRFYVNARTGMWLCFRCQEQGGPYRLLREVLELDHFMALRLREEIEGSRAGPKPLRVVAAKTPEPEAGIGMPPEVYRLTSPKDAGQEIFWRYLDGRGVTPKQIEQYRMGFALRGRYAYRVIIPVYSSGAMQTFVARTVIDADLKVLHPDDAHPSQALFNIDNITGKSVVLVEGVFDVLRIAASQAVASLGTNLSAQQRDLLRSKGIKRVLVLWDGDEPGRHGASHIADQLLAARFDVRVALLRPGEDPASARGYAIQSAIDKATTPSSTYLSERLSASRLDGISQARYTHQQS